MQRVEVNFLLAFVSDHDLYDSVITDRVCHLEVSRMGSILLSLNPNVLVNKVENWLNGGLPARDVRALQLFCQ